MRGEPIPLDVLAEADKLGLSIADFGEPVSKHPDQEGVYIYGSDEEA